MQEAFLVIVGGWAISNLLTNDSCAAADYDDDSSSSFGNANQYTI